MALHGWFVASIWMCQHGFCPVILSASRNGSQTSVQHLMCSYSAGTRRKVCALVTLAFLAWIIEYEFLSINVL